MRARACVLQLMIFRVLCLAFITTALIVDFARFEHPGRFFFWFSTWPGVLSIAYFSFAVYFTFKARECFSAHGSSTSDKAGRPPHNCATATAVALFALAFAFAMTMMVAFIVIPIYGKRPLNAEEVDFSRATGKWTSQMAFAVVSVRLATPFLLVADLFLGAQPVVLAQMLTTTLVGILFCILNSVWCATQIQANDPNQSALSDLQIVSAPQRSGAATLGITIVTVLLSVMAITHGFGYGLTLLRSAIWRLFRHRFSLTQLRMAKWAGGGPAIAAAIEAHPDFGRVMGDAPPAAGAAAAGKAPAADAAADGAPAVPAEP